MRSFPTKEICRKQKSCICSTAVACYALSANAAVVMPEVQRSFYCDTASGMAYFRYISQELPQLCSHFFSLSTEPGLNCIMGLSMGGFGALKCALTYPERYAGYGSFSGALRMDHRSLCNVLKQYVFLNRDSSYVLHGLHMTRGNTIMPAILRNSYGC